MQGPTEGGGAWDDARSGVEYTVNVKVANRRNTSVGARRDRRWSLNERQTPHVRGVRVALGTGCTRVLEGLGGVAGRRRD